MSEHIPAFSPNFSQSSRRAATTPILRFVQYLGQSADLAYQLPRLLDQWPIQEMSKRGYDKGHSCGQSCGRWHTGACLFHLVCPFLIYGALTETSIGRLFAAGIIPGILVGTMFMMYLLIKCIRNPMIAPRDPDRSSIIDIFKGFSAHLASFGC